MSRRSVAPHGATGQVLYPTRNFATLGPFIIVTPSTHPEPKWLTHFWPALMVAHEIGLSHPSVNPHGGVGV